MFLLVEYGLGCGGCCLFWVENFLEFVVCFFGVWCLGGIVVFVNDEVFVLYFVYVVVVIVF